MKPEKNNEKEQSASAVNAIVMQKDEVIDRLRGQLQNCVNHLERARNRAAAIHKNDYDKVIESANIALYETLGA